MAKRLRLADHAFDALMTDADEGLRGFIERNVLFHDV